MTIQAGPVLVHPVAPGTWERIAIVNFCKKTKDGAQLRHTENNASGQILHVVLSIKSWTANALEIRRCIILY